MLQACRERERQCAARLREGAEGGEQQLSGALWPRADGMMYRRCTTQHTPRRLGTIRAPMKPTCFHLPRRRSQRKSRIVGSRVSSNVLEPAQSSVNACWRSCREYSCSRRQASMIGATSREWFFTVLQANLSWTAKPGSRSDGSRDPPARRSGETMKRSASPASRGPSSPGGCVCGRVWACVCVGEAPFNQAASRSLIST